jgi:hypothetical protein
MDFKEVDGPRSLCVGVCARRERGRDGGGER